MTPSTVFEVLLSCELALIGISFGRGISKEFKSDTFHSRYLLLKGPPRRSILVIIALGSVSERKTRIMFLHKQS